MQYFVTAIRFDLKFNLNFFVEVKHQMKEKRLVKGFIFLKFQISKVSTLWIKGPKWPLQPYTKEKTFYIEK